MSSTRKRAANNLLRPGFSGPMRCMGDLLAEDVRGSPPLTSVRQEWAKGKNWTPVILRPAIRGPGRPGRASGCPVHAGRPPALAQESPAVPLVGDRKVTEV